MPHHDGVILEPRLLLIIILATDNRATKHLLPQVEPQLFVAPTSASAKLAVIEGSARGVLHHCIALHARQHIICPLCSDGC